MGEDLWIEIPNWDRFQHYKDRDPPWIKNYTDLLHRDDYLSLSSHLRGVLHGVWLEYASSSCHLRVTVVSRTPHLRVDARSLGHRLNLRVTSSDLERLNHAGFIHLVASNVLAERLQAASKPLAPRAPSQEAETEDPKAKTEDQKQNLRPSDRPELSYAAENGRTDGRTFANEQEDEPDHADVY